LSRNSWFQGWNIFLFQKIKYSKNDGDVSKGHRSQLERAHIGQIRDNLRVKINNSN